MSGNGSSGSWRDQGERNQFSGFRRDGGGSRETGHHYGASGGWDHQRNQYDQDRARGGWNLERNQYDQDGARARGGWDHQRNQYDSDRARGGWNHERNQYDQDGARGGWDHQRNQNGQDGARGGFRSRHQDLAWRHQSGGRSSDRAAGTSSASWETSNLQPIQKNIYSSGAASRTVATSVVEKYRTEKDIKIMKGEESCPNPVMTFKDGNFPDYINTEVVKAGFTVPTPIQSQSFTIALSGQVTCHCLPLSLLQSYFDIRIWSASPRRGRGRLCATSCPPSCTHTTSRAFSPGTALWSSSSLRPGQCEL